MPKILNLAWNSTFSFKCPLDIGNFPMYKLETWMHDITLEQKPRMSWSPPLSDLFNLQHMCLIIMSALKNSLSNSSIWQVIFLNVLFAHGSGNDLSLNVTSYWNHWILREGFTELHRYCSFRDKICRISHIHLKLIVFINQHTLSNYQLR